MIGDDIFVPLENSEWAKVIQDGRVALLEQRRFVQARLTGGYGIPLNTASYESRTDLGDLISEFSNIALGYRATSAIGIVESESKSNWIGLDQNRDSLLVVRLAEELELKMETKYWVIKDFETYFVADRRNILAAFPEIKAQIPLAQL